MSTPIPPVPIFPQNRAATTNFGPDLANSKALTNPQTQLDALAVNQLRAEVAALEASAMSGMIQIGWDGSAYSVLAGRGIPITSVTVDGTVPASPIVTILSAYGLFPVMAVACVCAPAGSGASGNYVVSTRINASGIAPTAVTVYLSGAAPFVLMVST
jgi:hypothetical protein